MYEGMSLVSNGLDYSVSETRVAALEHVTLLAHGDAHVQHRRVLQLRLHGHSYA